MFGGGGVNFREHTAHWRIQGRGCYGVEFSSQPLPTVYFKFQKIYIGLLIYLLSMNHTHSTQDYMHSLAAGRVTDQWTNSSHYALTGHHACGLLHVRGHKMFNLVHDVMDCRQNTVLIVNHSICLLSRIVHMYGEDIITGEELSSAHS